MLKLRRSHRQGNMAIVVALLLVLLLGVAAIVIDLGRARVVHYELENASEAAARAAAAQLDGTSAGLTAARTSAMSLAAANYAGGRSVSISSSDVVFGTWDSDAGTWANTNTPSQVNAVQVHARIPNLPTFFAQVAFLQDSVPVGAYSRATSLQGGAGAVECYIPLALPACQITRNTLDGMQNLTLKINPPGIDSVGWGRVNGSPNSNWTRDQINNCTQGGEAEVGDPVGLQNGVVTSALDALVTRISTSSTRWTTARWGTMPARMSGSSISAANYGKTYEGAVLVFDGGSSYCTGSGGSFNQSKPLVGFMWGAIYDVVNSGSSSSRTIKMRLDVRNDYNIGSGIGGPDYGVVVDEPPRMVR